MKKLYFFLFIIVSFGIGIGFTLYAITLYKSHREKTLFGVPYYTNIQLDSTNLPIVFINTHNKIIPQNKEFITASMTIVDNGANRLNYKDTITHPHQLFDYNGLIAIKYRGNSSLGKASDKNHIAFDRLTSLLKREGVKYQKKSSA